MLKKQEERRNELEMKEYRLSVSIDVHDFDTRVRNAEKDLVKGHKIKASIRFRGREMSHPELGREVLLRFANALESVASIEQKTAKEKEVEGYSTMKKLNYLTL